MHAGYAGLLGFVMRVDVAYDVAALCSCCAGGGVALVDVSGGGILVCGVACQVWSAALLVFLVVSSS